MHYYIYPAGRTGRTLGKMLDYCEMNATYSFIDDNKKGITLKKQALKIKKQLEKNEAEIVIALTQGIAITQSRMEKLIKNLEALEINRYLGNEFIQQVVLQVKIAKDKELLKEILKYRNEEVINFKQASGVIADSIVQIIHKER